MAVFRTLFLSILFAQLGCASDVARVLGYGAPLSAERCRSLNLYQIGFYDGENGQRSRDKFDFWFKDCRTVGVVLDAKIYDEGYALGLEKFCSCQSGIRSAMNKEILELKSQYFMCGKEDFAQFSRGFGLGEAAQKKNIQADENECGTSSSEKTK